MIVAPKYAYNLNLALNIATNIIDWILGFLEHNPLKLLLLFHSFGMYGLECDELEHEIVMVGRDLAVVNQNLQS